MKKNSALTKFILFIVGIIFFPLTIGYFLSSWAMRGYRKANVGLKKKDMRSSSIVWLIVLITSIIFIVCIGLWIWAHYYGVLFCRTKYQDNFFGFYTIKAADLDFEKNPWVSFLHVGVGKVVWLPWYWGITSWAENSIDITTQKLHSVFCLWSFSHDWLLSHRYGQDTPVNSWHWVLDWTINHYLVEYTIYGFCTFVMTKILAMHMFDSSIKATIEKDVIKMQEAQYNNAQYTPNHWMTDKLYLFVNYKYQEKIQYRLEASVAKKTHEMTMGNGAIVSRKSSILFFKEHWRYNAIFCGAPKSGITNDMMNWVLACSYHKSPIIFLDSDYNAETEANFKKMAQLNDTKLFLIDFINTNNKYNPFYEKDASQAAELTIFAFFKDKLDHETTSDIYNTFLKMEKDGTPFSFVEIIKAFEHNAVVSKEFKAFHEAFKEYLPNGTKDGIKIKDVLEPQKNAPILYFVTPSKMKSIEVQALKRMFFKDVSLSSSIGKGDRDLRNTNALFCFHGAYDLFNNANEVSNTFATFTFNNFAIGVDIKSHTFKDSEVEVIKELFFNAKTFFIHRNSDKNIANILTTTLERSRVVQVGFQVKEAVWHKTQGKKLEDLEKLEKTYKATISKIIATLNSLQIGEIYFKTLHAVKNERFQKASSVEDIIYDVPILSSSFEENLKGANKL